MDQLLTLKYHDSVKPDSPSISAEQLLSMLKDIHSAAAERVGVWKSVATALKLFWHECELKEVCSLSEKAAHLKTDQKISDDCNRLETECSSLITMQSTDNFQRSMNYLLNNHCRVFRHVQFLPEDGYPWKIDDDFIHALWEAQLESLRKSQDIFCQHDLSSRLSQWKNIGRAYHARSRREKQAWQE